MRRDCERECAGCRRKQREIDRLTDELARAYSEMRQVQKKALETKERLDELLINGDHLQVENALAWSKAEAARRSG